MMKTQTKIMLAICFLIVSTASIRAVGLDSLNRDPEYVRSIVERSHNIVDKLRIKDSAIKVNVVNTLANRYFELNDIYEKRDLAIQHAKDKLKGEAREAALQQARTEVEAALYRTHFAFPARLSLWLNESEIESIKDGMTYGVVQVTYTAQLDMIPSLTEVEKKQIYSWLIEAREYAIDAESSKKKHETFGKYKGRINNYLSQRGYNLTKEREEWEKRVKARGDTL